MNRCFALMVLMLPFCSTVCQTVSAADVLTQNFGQQHLFFPEIQVSLQFHCDDKPQVNWSLESNDRKLMSGIAKARDGVGTVELKTPPLKDGVTFKLKLTVDTRTEPFILVSRDIFSNQKQWLERLNIILIDGDDKIATTIFEDNGIPFQTTVDDMTTDSLIIVTNKEISEKYCRWAMQGNHVIVVAPENGDFVLPQMNFDLNNTFLLSNHPKSLFKNETIGKENELKDEVLSDILKPSYNTAKWLLVDVKDDRVVFQTFPINSSNTGWQFADFQFGHHHLFFVTLPIFDAWNTSPASQLFLKMIFEKMEAKPIH